MPRRRPSGRVRPKRQSRVESTRTNVDLSGKWRVVETPDLAEDYLDLSDDPHVVLKVKERGSVLGTYQFGAQSGELNGRLEVPVKGHLRLEFTFEGNDELDPVNGYGRATLIHEETMKGYMQYHLGDRYRFV